MTVTAARAPFLSLHALQALPPSLVNRDNTNSAKSIIFGDVRRVRVSSQAWKRATVLHMRRNAIGAAAYALRTTRFPALTADALTADHNRDHNTALAKAAAVFSALGLKAKPNGNTAVAVYASNELPTRVAQAINAHWDAIGDSTDLDDPTSEAATKQVVPDHVIAAARAALDVDKTIDLALTGRMLAEIAGTNVDGALNVGHAFSVHAASVESDFFTAVDDAAPADEPVSSNLGDTDLTAPVLYRAASIDRRLLRTNLSAAADPDTLAAAAEESWLRAFTESVPAAKNTSTNSHTLPSIILAVAGSSPQSLANAFVTPVAGDTILNDATSNLLALAQRHRGIRPDDQLTALVVDPALDDLVAAAGITTVTTLDDFVQAIQ